MTVYEISLLVAALFGVFACLSLASMILDRGSFQVFVTFALIAGLFAGLAHLTGAEGLDPRDIVQALAKFVEFVRGAT